MWRRSVGSKNPRPRPPSRTARGVPGRIWIPTLAATVTGVLILVVTMISSNGGGPEPSEPAGAEESTGLASAAARLEAGSPAPMSVARPDQWKYVKVTNFSAERGQHGEREYWLRADYSVLAYIENGEIKTTDGEDAGLAETQYFTDLVDLQTAFADLPSDDPAAILDWAYALVDERDLQLVSIDCEAEAECEAARRETWYRDGSAYNLISHLLHVGIPGPDVQAKLFRAMAEIPGVRDDATVDDTTGRQVSSVSWEPTADLERSAAKLLGSTHILIDPDTATYRGYAQYKRHLAGYEDTPILSEIVLAAGLVDEPGQRPQ